MNKKMTFSFCLLILFFAVTCPSQEEDLTQMVSVLACVTRQQNLNTKTVETLMKAMFSIQKERASDRNMEVSHPKQVEENFIPLPCLPVLESSTGATTVDVNFTPFDSQSLSLAESVSSSSSEKEPLQSSGDLGLSLPNGLLSLSGLPLFLADKEPTKAVDKREKKERISCDYCSKSYATKRSCKAHKKGCKKNPNREIFECPKPGCNKTFSYKCNFKRHMQLHTKHSQLECTWDGFGKRLTRKNHLTRHEQVHMREMSPGEGLELSLPDDLLSLGGISFSSTDKESTKAVDKREKKERMSCDYCNKSYATKSSCKAHKKGCKKNPNREIFECPEPGCNKSFGFKISLKSHIQSHRGDRSFVCSWDGCGKSYMTKSSCKAHEKGCEKNPNREIFKCPNPRCNKTFTYKGNLRRHIQLHRGDRPFVCTWEGCDRKFTYKYHLIRHERVHTKEKPYVCVWSKCGKKFARTDLLKEHMKVHTNKKK